MLKLLVFQGDREDAVSSAHLFVARLNAVAPEPVAGVVRYSDLVFTFTGGVACEIRISGTGELLEGVAKDYYVRDYQGYHAERYAVATYLADKGKKVFNSDTLRNESLSKLEQLIAFAAADIPTPKSSFAANPGLLAPFDYPYVMKSITASNNRLNFLVHSEREHRNAIREIRKKVLMQEYIENDGDYKAMVMFGHPLVVYKRNQANRFQTGKRPPRKVVQEDDVAALAQKTAAVLQREFCGVDIVRDKKSGKLYVLECNFNAGLHIKGIRSDRTLFAETVKLLQEL